MKAATNHLLDDELQRAAVEARSFVGEAPQVPHLMDKLVEELLTLAMQAGPGGGREVLIERANGLRMLADILANKDAKQTLPAQF